MRVLVTGASGFIGRHVVARLLADGHAVHAVDRVPFGEGLDEEDVLVGELEDQHVVDRAVAPGTDAIVHLAAETSVLGSKERPAKYERVNVGVTAALLEAARLVGVGTFALASTNAVVGVHEGTMSESVPLVPLTPYGATKAAAEMLMSGYAGAFGLRTPALRLTNVYGPGMGHKDSFVPRLLRAAADPEPGGVQVYGDGRQVRDLVHVHDVARAFAAAVVDWPSGPVIIGSGASHTVLDLVDAARVATGAPIPAEHVPAKPGEMPAVVVDTSQAAGRGFTAEIGLVEGFASAWPDFRPEPA